MSDVTWRVLVGDVREQLATIPDQSVQCCVTSPPYWGLRDYGHEGQIGLEPTPDAYVSTLVEVFREVRRVLKDDGTLWLNLGDSYASSGKSDETGFERLHTWDGRVAGPKTRAAKGRAPSAGLKPKDLVGIPWRVAFALQADGWYLRSDIIWSKPNPMPESVTDRPTKTHEYIFLLTKRERYYYDAGAIREAATCSPRPESSKHGAHNKSAVTQSGNRRTTLGFNRPELGRNTRTVWTVATQPYPEAHFATFPEALPERCIKAGSRLGDTVLDPFTGSGTTGKVAIRLGRSFLGCELNEQYADLARDRIGGAAPLFAQEIA